MLFDGDSLRARYADTGTYMGRFEGIEPTRRKVQALELVVYRIVDDRIGEMSPSPDIRNVIRQLS